MKDNQQPFHWHDLLTKFVGTKGVLVIDIEKLRGLRLAHPFQPFFLLLENGDRILVNRPLNFGMAPDGSRMGVVAPEGMRLLDPSAIKDAVLATASE